MGAVCFGTGMAVFGYCPGTSVAACGEGRRDAMVGVVGMLAGAALFVAFFGQLEPLVKKARRPGEARNPRRKQQVALVMGAAACAARYAASLDQSRRITERLATLMRTFITAMFCIFWPGIALACPFCNSATSDQVREGIFNADFGYHLAMSLAPFPILFGIVLLIYFGSPSRQVKGDRDVKAELATKESATTTTELR